MPVQFTYEPIATYTLGSSNVGTVITFSNIPQTYQDLYISVSSRSTTSGNANSIKVYNINGDTGNNYSYTGLFGDGTNTGGLRQSGISFMLLGGYTTALTAGVYEISTLNFNNYTSTTQFKTMLARRNSAGTVGYVATAAGSWRNTAAITSITIAQQVGDFANASTATLYGIARA